MANEGQTSAAVQGAEGAVAERNAGDAAGAAAAQGGQGKGRSDLARAFSEDGALKTHVGGQALIEGIMMRGKYNWAVAVREPSGEVYTEEHDLASGKAKNGWMSWPLVRGCRALVESLVLGYKALEIAALHAFAEDDAAEDALPEGAAAGSLAGSTCRDVPPGGGEAGEMPRSAAQSPEGSSCAALFQPTNEDIDGVKRISPASPPPGGASSCEGVEAKASSPSPSGGDSGGGGSADEGAAALEGMAAGTGDSLAGEGEGFSWERDFGRPDTVIDALGAQRTLEVVSEPEGGDRQASGSEGEFGKREMAVSMVLGLVLGVVLFIVAPAFITNLIVGEYDQNTLVWNIVDGLLRVAVFVFYLWLIGRMQDIKRMFGYHGAEHKTIHCYEHGLPLTPENARSFPRLHVRCGTAFLIMVMVIAIFVYTVVPLNPLIEAWGVPDGAPKLLLVILVRILFMPVIAGISYEITVKWAGSHPDNPLVKVILWPGMQMQYLTTNEPDDGMLECAIAAMQLVLEREQAEAAGPAAEAVAGAEASQPQAAAAARP